MSKPRPRKPHGETPRHGEAVDVVFETIRQGIITGRFAPGQRLVIRDLEEEIRPAARGTARPTRRDTRAVAMPNHNTETDAKEHTEHENHIPRQGRNT